MKTITLNSEKTRNILDRIRGVKVCVVGDACLDLYWLADMRQSRLSRETPHFPLPVVKEIAAPGGAANVARNAAVLGAQITLISSVGKDWRYHLLRQCLSETGVSPEHLLRSESRVTPTYCKPVRMGISDVRYEDPRLDFENTAALNADEEQAVLDALRREAEHCDIIAVCDQYLNGTVTPAVRELLMEIGGNGCAIVADSRDNIGLYNHMIVKPNEVEAAAVTGAEFAGGGADTDAYARVAKELSEKTGSPAIITLGARGALWCANNDVWLAPARKTSAPIDIVGAGDTFLSAFCCAYGSGTPGEEAVAFANLSSCVTIKKIGETGSASPDEIMTLTEERHEY